MPIVSDFFEYAHTLSIQIRQDISCWYQRKYANDIEYDQPKQPTIWAQIWALSL